MYANFFLRELLPTAHTPLPQEACQPTRTKISLTPQPSGRRRRRYISYGMRRAIVTVGNGSSSFSVNIVSNSRNRQNVRRRRNCLGLRQRLRHVQGRIRRRRCSTCRLPVDCRSPRHQVRRVNVIFLRFINLDRCQLWRAQSQHSACCMDN